MSLVLATVLIATVVLIFVKWGLMELPSSHVVKALKKIHGPNGLPFFIGITWDFMTMGTGGVIKYLEEMTARYPRVASAYLAGVPLVIVQKPQDIKHILGSNKNIKKGIEYDPIIPWLNEGLLTSYGSKWHSRRKMLTPTFHFKILEDALSSMTSNTEVLADKLSHTKKTVIVDDYITRCTLDIIGETAMGVQLNSQNNENGEYLKSVKMAAEMIVERILSVYQLRDSLFALSGKKSIFNTFLKSLHDFTDKVIAERKQSGYTDDTSQEDNLGRKKKKAFLDSLLSMQKTNPDTFTDMDIREEVDTIMFEGHDTTSTALCFCLWLLGSHPDVQEKLYQEIEDTVGEGEMTMTNINNMNYLEKVVKETLRLYPSVPYISRRITEDVYLDDGLMIPVGANVILLPYLLHRDPESFPDPEKFDPERFTEEASKGRHPYAYIPFSAGPRNCVGQKFAMLEMKVTIASVVRKCKIKAVTKKEDFKILPNLIIRPTKPVKCAFSPRTN